MSPQRHRAAGESGADLADVERAVLSARKRGKILGCRLVLAQGLDAELFAELGAFLSGDGADGLLALDVLRQLPDAQLEVRWAGLDPAGDR